MDRKAWISGAGLTLSLLGCSADEVPLNEEVGGQAEALEFLGLSERAAPPAASTFVGEVMVVRGTSQDGAPVSPRYFLRTEAGESLELGLVEAAQARTADKAPLENARVSISGMRANGKVAVQQVQTLAAVAPAAVTGARPWATVLCRFSDSTDTTPETPSWFSTLMSNSYPGMDHYWRELSYNNINLAGSRVFGWYDLPHPRSHYVATLPDGSTQADLGALATDCFAAGNGDANYSQFKGVNMMFNETLDNAAWGGSAYMPHDGVNANISTTWMPPWAFHNHDVLGQEMGHGLGLPHSSGPYGSTYDSNWDVMSGGGMCSSRHAEYGCVGVHTIAFHKDKLGWIPDPQKRTLDTVGSATFTLSRLASPVSDGYWMAKIPLSSDGKQFYTLEARRFVGYDDEVPQEGVLLHRVDLTRPDRTAQVVDATSGNANDQGAVWTVGETFEDSANGIKVEVLAESDASYWVRTTLAGFRLGVSRSGTGGATGRVTSNIAGINCGTDCSESYAVGTRVKLTASGVNGAAFDGWTGCDSIISGACYVTMDRARSVTASFVPGDPDCYSDCIDSCKAEGQFLPRQCVQLCRAECGL